MKSHTILAIYWHLSTGICVGMVKQNHRTIRLIDALNGTPRLNCSISYPNLEIIRTENNSSINNTRDIKGHSVKINPGPYAIVKGILLYEKQLL